MAAPLRRALCLAAVAAGIFSLSAVRSFVSAGGRPAAQPRVQMQAVSVNDKSDNFIDKAFTTMTDVVIGLIPLSQQEKDAYQFYRDGMAAQVSGDYSMALRSYAEALKLEEDPIDRSYIFYNLGIIFGSNGEYVKAVKYYHLSLDQNKELCQAYNNIAVIYHDQAVRAEKKGALDKSTVLYDKAALYWNQALRIAPTNYLEAQNWLLTTGRMNAEAKSKLGGGCLVIFWLWLLDCKQCFCSCVVFRSDIARLSPLALIADPAAASAARLLTEDRAICCRSGTVYAEAKDVNNESVDESSFLSFFGECEKESTNGEAADFPSKEDLQRLFTFWDEAGNGSLNEERVSEILRRFMKVVGKTAITDGVSIKANSLRKLEVGDVVEVLGPPTKEPEVDVMRVQVRLLADGTEGWATISGNQGTDYLQDGGGTFKVVKETLLTDDFEIGAAKETPKISRLVTREQFEAMSERDRLLLLEFLWERKRRKRESKDVMRTVKESWPWLWWLLTYL
ncbi:ycf3 [Symbiodinium sp. CCMP2592]|nr:ycf3 [Symbiodinium sp. CCMP2592]